MNATIKPIQGLRAILTMHVFLFHFLGIIGMRDIMDGYFTDAGRLGVKGFFVISGFLYGYLANQSTSVKYLVHNKVCSFLRKYYHWHLLFFLVMLPFIVIEVSNGKLPIWKSAIYAISNILLIHGQLPINGCALAFNDVSWYLSTALFLLLPTILISKKTRNFNEKKCYILLTLLVAFEMLFCVIIHFFRARGWFVEWIMYIPFPIRIVDIAAGVICGRIGLLRKNRRNALIDTALFVISSLTLILIQLSSKKIPIYYRYSCCYTLPMIALVYSILNLKTFGAKLLSVKPIKWIGDISFYIFICHLAVGKYLFKFNDRCEILNFNSSFDCIVFLTVGGFLTILLSMGMSYIDMLRNKKNEIFHNHS